MEMFSMQSCVISWKICQYRSQYFCMALENELEHINYQNMNVTSDDIMEEIQPYQPDFNSNDEEWCFFK